MGEMMGVSAGGNWPPKGCTYEYAPINAQWVSGTYTGTDLRFATKTSYIDGSVVEFTYLDRDAMSDNSIKIDAKTGGITGNWTGGAGAYGLQIETTKRVGNTFTIQCRRFTPTASSTWLMVVRFDREVSCKYIDNSYKEN